MRPLASRSFLLAAMLVAATAAACSSSAQSSDFGAAVPNNSASGGTGGSGDAATGISPGASDAGVASADQGNPLCDVVGGSACIPDDDAPPASNKCSSGLDGGGVGGSAPTDDGGYDAGPSPIACHVTLDPSTTETSAQCTAAGAGTNGVQCLGSDDCAAGFECVGSPGVCRHYCCGIRGSCQSNFFCDVQSETSAESVKVPVCEPVHSCQLLGADNMCAAGETCAIVNDNDGTTSCVSVGPANVGESCDATHCGKDLACLGDVGARKCFALCLKAKSTCDSSETCAGAAPLFQGVNSGIGICQ